MRSMYSFFKKSMYLDSIALVIFGIKALSTFLHSLYNAISLLLVSLIIIAPMVSVPGGIVR